MMNTSSIGSSQTPYQPPSNPSRLNNETITTIKDFDWTNHTVTQL
jgi:hypothetical protein